jgi:hypothetical protein
MNTGNKKKNPANDELVKFAPSKMLIIPPDSPSELELQPHHAKFLLGTVQTWKCQGHRSGSTSKSCEMAHSGFGVIKKDYDDSTSAKARRKRKIGAHTISHMCTRASTSVKVISHQSV